MISELSSSNLTKFLDTGYRFFKECSLPGTFNPEIFTSNWKAIIDSGIGKIFSVVDGDVFNGVIGGFNVPDGLTGDIVCQGSFWYVLPEFRTSRTGLKLLTHLEDWARQGGASRIVMSNIQSHQPEKMHKAYNAMGYSPLEVHYWKTL